MDGTRTATVTRSALVAAAERQGVASEVAEAIWDELAPAPELRGTGLRRDGGFGHATRLSRTVKVLLYVGAFLVIGSYGWWGSKLSWGAGALLALSIVYGAGFLATAVLASRRGFDDLAAAAATIVAFYVPVTAYAALRLAGFDFRYTKDGIADFYLWIDGGWVWMELAAILAGVVLYRVFRAPLLGLPLSLFVLFLAMDGTAHVVGLDFDDASEHAVGAAVLAFGLATGAAATFLDYLGFRRHALWPHVFAAVGVVSGLELLLADHSYELALILAGAAFFATGIWLGRVAYVIAGGLALWCGITALEPSPLVLTVSGLGAVGLAVWLSLAQSPLRRWLDTRSLPAPQRD